MAGRKGKKIKEKEEGSCAADDDIVRPRLLKEPRERAIIMGARYDPRDALMRLHVNAKNRGC